MRPDATGSNSHMLCHHHGQLWFAMRVVLDVIINDSVILLLDACFLSACCCAQLPNTEGFKDDSTNLTLRKVVQEVDVMFTVKNHHGHLVRNLMPTQISIYDNGEPPQQITYFQPKARLPVRLALVIDISDSVLARRTVETDAAKTFLKHELRAPPDVALVVGFNQRAQVAQTATHDLHLLSRAIKQLPAGGETAVYDAVALASRQLGTIANNNAPSLKAIILMTDGDDNSSKTSLKEAEEIAQQNEAVVFALDSGLESLRNDTAQKNLKSLSQVTGGEYFIADEEHVREAIAKVEDELRSQYAIGYKPAQTKPDGSFHKISIFVPKKFKVRHREGYFAR